MAKLFTEAEIQVLMKNENVVSVAYFGNIRTPISVVSGQHNGNIRTL